jgi:hypothetical protein
MKNVSRSALWFLALVGIALAQPAISSVPVAAAPPSTASYTPSALWLFQTYTRASYRAAFGQETPVCDPTQPYKTWFDTSVAPGTSVTYQLFDSSKGALVPLTMTATQAASLNLPGLPNYPAWVVRPTSATMQASGSPAAPVNAGQLATPAQAQMLAGLLGGTVVPDAMDGIIYTWNGETRGLYAISVNGSVWNCGNLLAQLYSQGVGYPGTLSPTTGQFTPAPPASASTLGNTPIPSRALLPTESFSNKQFGGDWMIVNSANAAPYTVAAAASTGGSGLSAADEAILNRIDANLKALTVQFNTPGRQ